MINFTEIANKMKEVKELLFNLAKEAKQTIYEHGEIISNNYSQFAVFISVENESDIVKNLTSYDFDVESYSITIIDNQTNQANEIKLRKIIVYI